MSSQTYLAFAQATQDAGILLCPTKSVRQGEDVSVVGYLFNATDPVGSYPTLNGQAITFEGDGVPGGFSTNTFDDFGDFSAAFPSPDAVGSWTVNASFSENADYLGTFTLGTYTTAPSHGVYDNSIASGSGPQHVDLAGLNFSASMDFGEILPPDGIVCEFADPPLLVAECDSPVTDRFTPLRLASNDQEDICLEIFPSVNFQGNYNVTISFDGRDSLPDGFIDSDVDLFFEDAETSTISEITTARGDADNKVVSGGASAEGKFIVAIANHGEAPEGAIRQHVLVGNNQTVAFRDIGASVGNTTATITHTDVTASSISVDIHFANANINNDAVDIMSAQVNSTSSTPASITVPFTETGPDTGDFTGSFSITSTGSTSGSTLEVHDNDRITILPTIQAYYGRLQATFGGVSEAGVVELSDGEFSESIDSLGFSPIIQPVNVTLVDAQLEVSGMINVTMSYANGLFGSNPLPSASFLRLYHESPGGTWDNPLDTAVDTATMTAHREISALTAPGLYTLGFDGSGPGGAGGGLGKPGIGVVVDFIASLPAAPGGGGGGGSSGGSHHSSHNTPVATSQETTSNKQVPAGSDVQVTSSTQGGETITIAFNSVESPGSVTITEKTLSSLGNIMDSGTSATQGSVLIGSDHYGVVGQAYEITPSGITFSGYADVTIPYNETLVTSNGSSESDLRFLHYDGSKWEDVTISIDTEANTITGRLFSFSPIVVGVSEDGTFSKSYFELHPLGKMNVNAGTSLGGTASIIDNATIVSTRMGKEIKIIAILQNFQQSKQPYSFIVQITDGKGIVQAIDSYSSSADRGMTSDASTSWSPEQVGTYTIKIFVWDDVNDAPAPLSEVTVKTVMVTD